VNRLLTSIFVAALIAVAGCVAKHAAPTTAASPDATITLSERSTAYSSEARRNSIAKGRQSDVPKRMRLDVYVLSLPYGTVSRNAEFWKRVNEQALDVATYDLLYKNGVRVGEAPIAEYDRFKQAIEDQPGSFRVSKLVKPEATDVDLDIRKEVPSQLIWYFNGVNELIGKSFDRCENFITMSYQPAPRKRETIRIVLCPVVKSMRKQLQWMAGNKELEVWITQPERFYDVNLRADVAHGSFLIVAPSAESTWPGSIGNRFFVTDAPAEQLENVLLIVPREASVE
jgi:hypothetical protein